MHQNIFSQDWGNKLVKTSDEFVISHNDWKHFGDNQCFHLYSPKNHTKLLHSFTSHGRPDGISLCFTIQHCPFCAGKMGKFLES